MLFHIHEQLHSLTQAVAAKSIPDSDSYEAQERCQFDKDFATIEFLLRTGNRKLEMYSAPTITNIH